LAPQPNICGWACGKTSPATSAHYYLLARPKVMIKPET